MDVHGRAGLMNRSLATAFGLMGCMLAAAGICPAGAQTARDTLCTNQMRALSPDVTNLTVGNGCLQLAGYLNDKATESAYHSLAISLLAPRDVQSTKAGTASPPGSPAQSEAVPGTIPSALASATLAAVGSTSGPRTIASISLNPAMFVSSSTDPSVLARTTRIADVTLFFPVNGIDANKDGKIDYFGLRARLNLTGASQGNRLIQQFTDKMRTVVAVEEKRLESLMQLMKTAPDLAGCVAALTSATTDAAAVRGSCGGLPPLAPESDAYQQVRALASQVREEADAAYAGLDLRLDVGDPTFGAVAGASGTVMVAGLGFGRRFGSPEGATGGLRGRLAARYVSLDGGGGTNLALDGGLALDAARPLDEQQSLLGSLGIEFRYSSPPAALVDRFQTRQLVARGSVSVPLGGGAALSITLSEPLIGGEGAKLSVNGNWALLLSKIAGRI